MKKLITIITLLITVLSYSQKRPSSMPDNGRIGGNSWTIEDYRENAKEASLMAVRVYNAEMIRVEATKPKEKPKKLKEKGWFAKNIIDTKDDQRRKNENLIKQQGNYEENLKRANASFDRKIKDVQKYRDEWVEYLKAEKIAKAKAKKDREIEKERKRIQKENNIKIANEKAKIEQQERNAEWDAMPKNPEYIKWKNNYEKALSLSQKNVDRCEAIIKKNTFKNAIGQKVYDSSDFSKTDKTNFNKNLDLIFERSDEIGDLESERKFLNYWNETVSTEKSIWSYQISSYFYSKSKVY